MIVSCWRNCTGLASTTRVWKSSGCMARATCWRPRRWTSSNVTSTCRSVSSSTTPVSRRWTTTAYPRVSSARKSRRYDTYAVPGSGEPLFQAAAANLNPWTEAKVDTKNPDRGPLLIISGELDHTVPWAIANASFKREKRNPGITEIVEIKGRGHSLTIDSGWREVADTALAFVRRFV